ncbi:Rieske 2Fe-2S domain-containing protein [Streptomyces sp. MBT70]|nr:Rieske 2Fe-2S domain-containing protein [Streptomyces sp. MBT70]GGS09967.1 hypothetical protein GCM10010236_75570 [Streptomyces eurythermus]
MARVAGFLDGVAGGANLGEELVVYGDGRDVTVAEGFCPHRGVALRLGRTRDGALECPVPRLAVHWGSGRCTRVPPLPPGRTSPGRRP